MTFPKEVSYFELIEAVLVAAVRDLKSKKSNNSAN